MPAPTIGVAKLPERDDQGGVDEGVQCADPFHALQRGAEIELHGGDGHIDDRDVDDHDHQRHAHDKQRDPLGPSGLVAHELADGLRAVLAHLVGT